MNRHIKPTSDLFIRYLLGSESNKDVLLDFINSFLEDEGFPPAVSLEIKNPFNLKKLPDAKESVLDVKAQDSRGRIFDVEIQVIGNQHYIKRSVYYWAKLYESQLGDGDIYTRLKPVICINVLDFSVFPELKQAHSCFMLTETEEKEYILTDDMQIHFLELDKMNLAGNPDFKNRLEKWTYYLKNEGSIQEEDEMTILLKNDPIMQKAHATYKDFTANDELVELAEARMKHIRDQGTLIEGAREEAKKEDAQRMLEKDYPIQDIAEITGLSLEEIKKLR